MRIPQNRPASELRKTSKSRRSQKNGTAFTLDQAEGQPGINSLVATAPHASIGDISALLAVQGATDGAARRGAISKGHDTLNALDDLKVDVLAGRVSRYKLVRLKSMIDQQQEEAVDPGLKNVLAHIELRARVELAKLEQRGKV